LDCTKKKYLAKGQRQNTSIGWHDLFDPIAAPSKGLQIEKLEQHDDEQGCSIEPGARKSETHWLVPQKIIPFSQKMYFTDHTYGDLV